MDETPNRGTRIWKGPPVEWDPLRPRFADVNHWHPVSDWDAYARACDAKCVGVKIGEGGLLSKGASEAVRSAESRGLVVIGYNYGTQGVDAFLRNFDPRPGRIPCLDFEGASAAVASAEAWIRAVTAAYGRRPWFYGRSKWMSEGAPLHTEVSRCPYWGSQYGHKLNVPLGVGDPVAWQYTDGQLSPSGGPREHAGVGYCDMNVLLMTADQLATSSGLKV